MLSDKVINHLNENADLVLPEFQLQYKKILKDLEFNYDKNSSFIEFMIKYNDEHYGSEGCLNDVMSDLKNFEKGITKHLRDNYGVPEKYISLFNLEVDDYLLYNKDDDSVVLIEGGNDIKLKKEEFDKKWNSFNEFLEDFFELN